MDPMTDPGPWLLFSSAFISSTLLPGGSEALFGVMLWQGNHSPWLLWGVASVGNTLGGMTSWGVGRLIAWRYPAQALEKPGHRGAVARLRRYGSPVLLFSWVPIIGDPLCVAGGWLGVPWPRALLLIAAGKAARYGAILAAMS